jgi:SAM-dependent methyltransferase
VPEFLPRHLVQSTFVDASAPSSLPTELFDRIDETPDARFYVQPRLVAHIDPETIAALADYYREVLPADADVLDLMSSWISHLPHEVSYGRVAGLGMNAVELDHNTRLTERVVHDLNAEPSLPWPDAHFDAVLNAVSIQYLVRPVEVFAEIARVLRPGGLSIVAMSHRCFPTKAIRAFHAMGRDARFDLVTHYHEATGGFATAERTDRSPTGADPLWIVTARRLESVSQQESSS